MLSNVLSVCSELEMVSSHMSLVVVYMGSKNRINLTKNI